ncbi:MAG: hypothetical protein B6244_12815 [Candidatus Cloacimonetes bacterium 4572_55]|nr:MAG: hypothetical protein B6244_12815 [Candidatus Cloacimonetes bacterium 4572_55]
MKNVGRFRSLILFILMTFFLVLPPLYAQEEEGKNFKYEITRDIMKSLNESAEQGDIPENLVVALAPLQGKVFINEQAFRQELVGALGRQLSAQYQSRLVDMSKIRVDWFDMTKITIFIILIAFCGMVLFFSWKAKTDPNQFIRRIPGLDAISEAIGRCTEMGKPVLYVPGIDDMNNIQTIASMVILENVARVIGEYESDLIVPIRPPFVVPVAEEMVKKGYLDAGRPDAFKPENVRFISDEQFAYAAGVNGIMLREKPAANLLLGSFFAESLVIAETGVLAGAIQVAGTANEHQLPFFVAACDYTLIGEEIYAASAYLSKDPELVGSLKGSDWAKVVLSIIMLLGVVLETFGVHFLTEWFFIR